MNIGLVGWGIASGNGGMNSDIISLASWVTHWLIPNHPRSANHPDYLERGREKIIVECKLSDDNDIYNKFLDEVDGILYIEHPCITGEYDIVSEANKRGKIVIGIPMWEWWPERKSWALNTDMLWAVTKASNEYLRALSMTLFMHGYHHSWRGHVFGSSWGVNLEDFPFRKRSRADKFVFINGNGGYKLRKASDIVFDAFSRPGAPPLLVYTQSSNIANFSCKNITLIDRNFPRRMDVYSDGDIFLFPSYWEGLCHGIYEGQASGGVVVTSDHPPMNECGTPFLISIEKYLQEDLSGKKICKAVPDSSMLYTICKKIYQKEISDLSMQGRNNIEQNFNLRETLDSLYWAILNVFCDRNMR